jgi:hypothetical protein
MKVAINRCFGGFGLSREAYKFLGIPWDKYGFKYNDYDKRTDPELIRCIETLGRSASGSLANVIVVTIPNDIEWEIDDYDGQESVEEKHRSW